MAPVLGTAHTMCSGTEFLRLDASDATVSVSLNPAARGWVSGRIDDRVDHCWLCNGGSDGLQGSKVVVMRGRAKVLTLALS